MENLEKETQEKLHAKFNEMSMDMHEVLAKHGFPEVSIQQISFGGPVPGGPCGMTGSGMTWQYSCHMGVCKLVCQ